MSAFGGIADIECVVEGHKKPGTWPGFRFLGSGGAIIELYANRGRAISAGDPMALVDMKRLHRYGVTEALVNDIDTSVHNVCVFAVPEVDYKTRKFKWRFRFSEWHLQLYGYAGKYVPTQRVIGFRNRIPASETGDGRIFVEQIIGAKTN